MPFIWDDFVWLLIDDEEPYDRNRFVVARKLRVKPNTDPQCSMSIQEFSVDQIRQCIQKFGEIESIEILPTNEAEAHVTFVSDRSAYLMVLQHQYDKQNKKNQPFEMEPVDSWEQPPENISQPPEHDMEIDEPEQTSQIFMLNEDCLLHVFKFLDLDSLVNLADVCQMFNRLLHQHSFPHIRKYEVFHNDETDTLAKMHRTMLCIGPYITDISYEADYDCGKRVYEYYDDRTLKFLKVIAQNAGKNIRRAYFEFGFNQKTLTIIAPILKRLESLKIADYEGAPGYDIDFHALCPNLIKFKVVLDIPLIACCKPWPSLRSLSVQSNLALETQTLVSFIKQNRQLTCLEFRDNDKTDIVVSAITKYLTNLEKVTIYDATYTLGFARNIDKLKVSPLLSEIKLENLNADNLKGVIDHLATFTHLRKIKLGMDSSDYGHGYEQSLVKMAKKLPFLEKLKLEQISLDGDILVDFVKSARQLKSLRIKTPGLTYTDALILELVNVLKISRQESDKALRLYLDYWHIKTLDVAKYEKFRRYLQLKRIY